MSDNHDDDLNFIKALIEQMIEDSHNKAVYAKGRKNSFAYGRWIRQKENWARLLDRFNRAEIQWPESGGEGS